MLDGPRFIWPPLLGQQSISWNQVFPLIKRPELLWTSWGPSKSLDKYSLEEQWACYNTGEPVFNNEGIQTGIKPPLRLVEQYFLSDWRKGKTVSLCLFILVWKNHEVKYSHEKHGSVSAKFPNGWTSSQDHAEYQHKTYWMN